VRIRPGRNLIWLAAVLATFSLGVFVWPEIVWLYPFAVISIAVLVVLDHRALKVRFANVSVDRTLPTVVGRDVPFLVELRVENNGRDSLSGELRDLLPSEAIPSFETHQITMAAGEMTQSFRSELRIPVRGCHEFGPVWIRLRGPRGLLESQQSLSCTDSIQVLPEIYCSPDSFKKDATAQITQLDKRTQTRQHGIGTDFESLAEFRQGDDPRRIDWRTTARYRRPIVRRHQIERYRDMMIVLDCGRLMGADAERGTKLDCAVDAGLMLARVALESGDRCGLGVFDDQILGYLPPVAGLGSIRSLSDSMYDLQSRWRESDFSQMFAALQTRQAKRSLIVVLSDIVDAETSTRFRTSLATLARRHLVLFVALQTPLLSKILKSPVTSLIDGAQKAITFRLLRERELAMHSVKRSGVHVLDVQPSQLTVPLINQFIELRQRNLL